MTMNITKLLRLLSLSLCLILMTGLAEAHTMWLETSTRGAIGRGHQVSLYFGEFSMADRTPIKGWLKGMHEGTWQVLTPSGELIDLRAHAMDSCYVATFHPQQQGWYRIHYSIVVPELWRGSQLRYQSLAWVYVGQPSEAVTEAQRKSPFGQGITFLPPVEPRFAVGSQTHFPVVVDSGSYKGLKVTIQGDNGWAKNYYRYPEGQLSFTPIWSGRYLMSSTKQRTLAPEEAEQYAGAKGVYDMITYFFSF